MEKAMDYIKDVDFSTENIGGLKLDLIIDDPNVVNYLESFDPTMRDEKAIEALRVGVIAIQSASPTLDTAIVEQKFREVDESIKKYLIDFENDISGQLDDHFKPESGIVPRSMDALIGKNGTLNKTLDDYFGPSKGKVNQTIQDQIGPGSNFAKSLDPESKESVISHIEEGVEKHLQEKVAEILNEFSLDKDGSAISRLRLALSEEISELDKNNTEFFVELREQLGIEKGKAEEAEKGTGKGREFEEELYDRVAEIGRQLEDTTELVGSKTGKNSPSKVGDYLITLGESCAAPGKRIVVEVKKQRGVKLQSAIEELKRAKENREADVGIYVYAKGVEPPEVGDFLRVGDDFFVTADEESLADGEPLLFLEAAYKILRILLASSQRKKEDAVLDLDKIRSEINVLIKRTEKFSVISTKATTIRNNSRIILDTVEEMEEEITAGLNVLAKMLE